MSYLVRVADAYRVSEEREYLKFIAKISDNVRRVRLARGLSQEDMEKFGFNYRHYQKLESGAHSFNLYTLFRIAKAFKVNIKDLIL